MDANQPLSPEQSLTLRIDFLFSGYREEEPAEDLRTISEYFEFLSARIDPDGGDVAIPPELLRHFEAVSLLLRDRLRLYPSTVLRQVEAILDSNIERLFAILSTFSRRDIRRMLRPSWRFIGMLPFFLPKEGQLSQSNLFDAKVSLNRLSQILRYASTIQLLDYDIDGESLADHYDPRLVDKTKLLALVHLFKAQVESIPDASMRQRLIEQIDNLEHEVRKPHPRWGRVIAGFFILFSFVADVKSVSPGTYDAIYKTISSIVASLHEEGGVEHQRRTPLVPDRSGSVAVAALPRPMTVPKPDHEASE